MLAGIAVITGGVLVVAAFSYFVGRVRLQLPLT